MSTKKGQKGQGSPSQSAAAKKVLDGLRAFRSIIPGYQVPHSKEDMKRLTPTAAVSDGALETVAVAVDGSQELKNAGRLDPANLRDAIRYSNAFDPVADEFEAMARAMRYSIAVKRAEAGEHALRIYELAKGLARRKDSELSQAVRDIKASLGKRGTRRRAKAEPESGEEKK